MTKRRADLLVVEQGLATTRARAQALILAGAVVTRGGEAVGKPGQMLLATTELILREQPLPYVSRGGLKLEAALRDFGLVARGRVCLDVGASTGGFTDCLLQHGAARVYAVDVGYGQLAWSLRQDPRVVVIERCNLRTAGPSLIPEPCSLVVVDVSFISLRLIVPKARQYMQPGGDLVVLVKPQFEVGRAQVGKGGIVRDSEIRAQAVRDIAGELMRLGFGNLRTMESPIRGAKGNVEYLVAGALT